MVLKVAVELLAAHDIQVIFENTEVGGSGITIVDADSVPGQLFLSKPSLNEQALLVFSSGGALKHPGRIVLEKPIRVQDMKDALHDMCLAWTSKRETVEHSPAVSPEPTSTNTAKVFDTDLLGSLIKSARAGTSAHYTINPDLQLWINGPDNTIAASCGVDKLEILGGIPSKSFLMKDLTPEECSGAVESQNLSTNNLSALLWKMAQRASKDQLLGGYSHDTPLKLKAWPNFTRYGASQKQIQLSAMLSRSSKSIDSLQKHTGIDRAEIIGFCNAAYAMGLLEAEPIPASNPFNRPKMPNKRAGLLNRLAQRLSFSTA